MTMSQPPTSSPLTNSWGIVGQPDRPDSSWRMRGSGRMSTAAKGASSACRAATVRALKPHAGASGVPFMKRMISFSRMASSMASRRGFSDMSRLLGLEREGMDGATDLVTEDGVDHLVLLDPALAGERGRDDDGAEVVPAARPVLDLGSRTGDRGLDPALEIVGGGHLHPQVSERYPL